MTSLYAWQPVEKGDRVEKGTGTSPMTSFVGKKGLSLGASPPWQAADRGLRGVSRVRIRPAEMACSVAFASSCSKKQVLDQEGTEEAEKGRCDGDGLEAHRTGRCVSTPLDTPPTHGVRPVGVESLS